MKAQVDVVSGEELTANNIISLDVEFTS
jgi:hypothetical protein